MKIQNLSLEGFLSYQEKVEIDFTSFELACISGENGSGKSSILEAVTWVIFGKARQSNESLINLQSDTAIVTLSFEYAGENYIIQRSNQRGKAARLTLKTPELDLTERTTRDTQNKIENILKVDYDTFTNAVFFLQGQSDQFVSASSGQRKKVLFDILGLGAWEDYRLKAASKIKEIEQKMEQSRGSMQILEEDIRGEGEFQEELKQVKQDVKVALFNQTTAQTSLDQEQKVFDKYQLWENNLQELKAKFEKVASQVTDLISRKTLLDNQQAENQELLTKRDQIIVDYERHQEVTELQLGLQASSTEWNKLNNKIALLVQVQESIDKDLAGIPGLEESIKQWKEKALEADKYEIALDEIKENQIKWKVESDNLKARHVELHTQIKGLEGHEVCPLCEQKLKNPAELINKLRTEQERLEPKIQQLKEEQDNSIDASASIQRELSVVASYAERITTSQQMIYQYQEKNKGFDRGEVENVQQELNDIDYDPAKELELRQELATLHNASRSHGLLEGAEKTSQSLVVQIKGLEKDLDTAIEAQSEASTDLELSKDKYTEDYDLSALESFEGVLQVAREDYDRQVKREGQVEAKLQNIEIQKTRLKEIKEKEKANTELHQRYCVLQEAFSKKGVPALLVEMALPQIEDKANQLLTKLSGGTMQVHFVTQKGYADSSREDLKETLDIEIQDQFGIRDYEMFSGGESFRINFAIRMALSHVLANRAGAKLRTLVIDEGFGSQDANGRDRLIEAINIVQEEYSTVLVISHIQEVMQAFPVQILVEKTATGSQVRIQ